MRNEFEKYFAITMLAVLSLGAVCCANNATPAAELKAFPIDEGTRAISGDGAAFDKSVSKDGNGSFKLQSGGEKTVFKLFEIDRVNIDAARLIYRATVKTQAVEGKVYLEMLCGFPAFGEFFSRSLDSALSGSNDWHTMETLFFLEKGQTVSTVKLNLVIEGKGTVWVDDVHLIRASP